MPEKKKKANEVSGEGCGGLYGGRQVCGEWDEQQKIC